jgi:hypothetical protein
MYKISFPVSPLIFALTFAYRRRRRPINSFELSLLNVLRTVRPSATPIKTTERFWLCDTPIMSPVFSMSFLGKISAGPAKKMTNSELVLAPPFINSHLPRVELQPHHFTSNAVLYTTTTPQKWRRRTILLDGGLFAPYSAYLPYSLSFLGSLSASFTVAHLFSRLYRPTHPLLRPSRAYH